MKNLFCLPVLLLSITAAADMGQSQSGATTNNGTSGTATDTTTNTGNTAPGTWTARRDRYHSTNQQNNTTRKSDADAGAARPQGDTNTPQGHSGASSY